MFRNVDLKNLIILFSFFSIVLMSIMVYILNERVVYLEERDPVITVELIVSGQKPLKNEIGD